MKEDVKPNVYDVPKGYDSRILIKGFIALKSLLLWLVIVFIGSQISNYLHLEGMLQILTIVFHMFIGIVLLTPRISHPDRPTYQILGHILLEKDNNQYSSIDINKYKAGGKDC
ncbi:hypothetical protein K4S71_09760 [Staphylococcus epidermidis]|nr:hypothetical protein [Staphylococcus epidermidis]MCG1591648.1 hypothetical protein [Staphylococcus epidermidis]MCG2478639.1 hypothetical protein [Staphylococcus epidermidis]